MSLHENLYAAKKLKKLRLELEQNQSEMAVNIGVSQPYYSSVESGKKPITNNMIETICTKYNINRDYFFNTLIEIPLTIFKNKLDDERDNIKANNEYMQRFFDHYEVMKDEAWILIHNEAHKKMLKVQFLYQRILDVKILLKEHLKIKIKGEGYVGYEASIMHGVFNDNNLGMIRIGFSTKDELIEYCKELDQLIHLFDMRFFELFRILYRGLQKIGKYPFDSIPESID